MVVDGTSSEWVSFGSGGSLSNQNSLDASEAAGLSSPATPVVPQPLNTDYPATLNPFATSPTAPSPSAGGPISPGSSGSVASIETDARAKDPNKFCEKCGAKRIGRAFVCVKCMHRFPPAGTQALDSQAESAPVLGAQTLTSQHDGAHRPIPGLEAGSSEEDKVTYGAAARAPWRIKIPNLQDDRLSQEAHESQDSMQPQPPCNTLSEIPSPAQTIAAIPVDCVGPDPHPQQNSAPQLSTSNNPAPQPSAPSHHEMPAAQTPPRRNNVSIAARDLGTASNFGGTEPTNKQAAVPDLIADDIPKAEMNVQLHSKPHPPPASFSDQSPATQPPQSRAQNADQSGESSAQKQKQSASQMPAPPMSAPPAFNPAVSPTSAEGKTFDSGFNVRRIASGKYLVVSIERGLSKEVFVEGLLDVDDEVQSVNGHLIHGKMDEEVNQLLRGPHGSLCHVVVLKQGAVEPLTLQLSRQCQALERSASAPQEAQNREFGADAAGMEVTVEALVNLGITDEAEQASILGYDPRSRRTPQPPPSNRRDEVTIAQLIAIGVTDPAEQARILGSAAGGGREGAHSAASTPQQPPPLTPQNPLPASDGGGTAGSSSLKDKKTKSKKMKVLGRAEVDMSKPFSCGSFKNAYIGMFEGTKIVILAHRQGGTSGNPEIMQEIDILQRLPQHPHITKYLGNFVYGDGGICLAMELCRYGGLDEWLMRKKGKTLESQKLIISSQICASMCAVAQQGIIHRDLAAHNVLVYGEDPLVVKLTDFGRSIHMSEAIPAPKKEILAVRWAAPEILAAPASWTAPWTEKSDVWAFAITVWQVFADGEVPYTLAMPDAAIKKRVLDGISPPRPVSCPNATFTELQKCWAFEADQRPTFQLLSAPFAANAPSS